MSAFQELIIHSYDDLLKHEEQILERINTTAGAASLYLMDPIRLFGELNIQLSDCAERELTKRFPLARNRGAVPYEALKNAKASQRIRVRIRSSQKECKK